MSLLNIYVVMYLPSLGSSHSHKGCSNTWVLLDLPRNACVQAWQISHLARTDMQVQAGRLEMVTFGLPWHGLSHPPSFDLLSHRLTSMLRPPPGCPATKHGGAETQRAAQCGSRRPNVLLIDRL